MQNATDHPSEPMTMRNLGITKGWKLNRGDHIPTFELPMLESAAQAVLDSYFYVASLLAPYMDIDTRGDFVHLEKPLFCVQALALAALV